MTSTPNGPQAGGNHDTHLRPTERATEALSHRIKSGTYPPGELLPTERVLAAELGVHRRSIRIAIERLVESGLLTRGHNRRPVVGSGTGDAVPGLDHGGGRKNTSRLSASNLVALIMWHGGGPLEHAGSSQQRIFWGVNQALTHRGFHAVFLDLGGEHIGTEEQNAAQEAEHLRYVQKQGFGGALFYPYAYRQNQELVREVSQTVPMVLLDRKMEGVDVDFVGIKNRQAMFDVTNYLIEQGHRRIVHITRFEPIVSVQDRIQGYLDAVRTCGRDDVPEAIVHMPWHPYSEDRTWEMVDLVFRQPAGQRPTAAVCVNDYVAIALASHLESIGLSVPGDVSVTGFDNIVPTMPNGLGLTTLAQPYEEVGKQAVDVLMRRLQNRKSLPTSLELEAALVVRGSSRPLP